MVFQHGWRLQEDGGVRARHHTIHFTRQAHLWGRASAHTASNHFVNGDSLHSLEQIEGLPLGAKADLANGLIRDLASRIVLDIKAEFLETASALADEGHKDPAAVLACIVLEDSLKRLAAKHSIANAADKEMSVVTL